jgi:hypothetical protein
VKPKVTRYKVGKLYKVWYRNNELENCLFSSPNKQDSSTLIGFVKRGAIVVYLDEPKWGFYEETIGWIMLEQVEKIFEIDFDQNGEIIETLIFSYPSND